MLASLPSTARAEANTSCRLSQVVLGGSWVVISTVTIVITYIKGLTTPLITTHEPPSGFKPRSHFQIPVFTCQCNIGAVIIRIGFGVYSTIIIINKEPPKPYSNY